MYIAENLRKIRLDRGIKQKDMPKLLKKHGRELSLRAYADWEAGLTTPKASDLPKLAVIFGVDIDLFFKQVQYYSRIGDK